MRKILCIATCLLTCGLSNRASAGCNAANANNGSLEVRANGQLLSANQLVYITSTPTMPTLTAKLTGSPSGTLIWTFDQKFVRGSRNDGPSYTETLSASETWDINGSVDDEFFGGKITIQLEDDDGKTCSFTFHIRGTNPSESTAENYIGTSPWYAIPIAKHESDKPSQDRYYCQFNNPDNWAPSAASLKGACPNMESDAGEGWGIFQITDDPAIEDLWNWQTNVDTAKSRLTAFAEAADQWMNDETFNGVTQYPGQRVQAEDLYGTPVPIDDDTYGNVTFSDAPGAQYTFEDGVAIKLYNGGKMFYSWIKDSETEGHWNRNGTDYITAVCAEVE